MKRLMAILSMAALIVTAGCDGFDKAEPEQVGKLRLVYLETYMAIEVLELDGTEYILVTHRNGVAICPKRRVITEEQ